MNSENINELINLAKFVIIILDYFKEECCTNS